MTPIVQAILAARIDRPAPEAKQLLQAAAVIGKDVPIPMLPPSARRQKSIEAAKFSSTNLLQVSPLRRQSKITVLIRHTCADFTAYWYPRRARCSTLCDNRDYCPFIKIEERQRYACPDQEQRSRLVVTTRRGSMLAQSAFFKLNCAPISSAGGPRRPRSCASTHRGIVNSARTGARAARHIFGRANNASRPWPTWHAMLLPLPR
jgi:hypothetical protein